MSGHTRGFGWIRSLGFSLLIVVLMFSVLPVGSPTVHSAVSAPGSDDWWMFRHDLQHSGYSTSTAPNTNNTLWNYTTGSYVYSSPAVADGKVYVGSYDDKVYCLNAATGAHVWNYTTGGDVYSSPAVADGKVYVGSVNNKVYCLNASTGAFIWSYTTGSWIYSSPAVADGKVYVGSTDKKVYCLNASTGAFIWSYTTGGNVVSSPAVADGKVYVGSVDKKVYCLNASTGAFIWGYTTGWEVFSSPAVADGKVYVGSTDNKVYCLNAATGAHVWNYTTGSYVYSSPAVADGKVYVGSLDNKVYCLNASTGAFIWSYTAGNDIVSSSPAVADGKVYVGSSDNKTYCLNATNGAFIWSYTTGDKVAESSPAVADGKVYVGSNDKKVYCFGLPTTASLVVRGGDNKVWYRTYSGTWGSWHSIAAATGDSLGAAMLGNNLHIIARNLAGTTIWHGYVNLATNVFSGWTLISGHPVSAPTLASNGTVLSLVVRGGDNKVWYRTYSGGVWGTWYPIAAATGDSLGAAMLGDNLHIIARNMAGTAIYHGYVNVGTNAFSGWTLISGVPVSAPTLTSNGAVLCLVVRGGDNKVWYRTYSGGVWGTWYPIAAATGDSLGAAMLGNDLHIVARNLAGTTIWHGYVNLATNAFSGWTLISGQPISKPTLTS